MAEFFLNYGLFAAKIITLVALIVVGLAFIVAIISGVTDDLCYVGHNPGLHPALTVWQNLLFIEALLPTTAGTILSALEYFKLDHKRSNKLSELSKGQVQQLSLSRLCLTRAKLWILDEPLANLDHGATKLLCDLCVAHLERGGILIYATHHKLHLEGVTTQCITLET